MRGRTLGLVLTVIAAACDGGGPSGTSGNGFAGRYTGVHRFSFGGVAPDINCTGSVVINNVTGTAVAGTLTIDPCPQLQSPNVVTTVISGTLSPSGSLSFTIPGLEQFVEGVNAQGCTVTRVDSAFAGTIVNDRIDASFTATVVCPTQQGDIAFAWRVDVTKTT